VQGKAADTRVQLTKANIKATFKFCFIPGSFNFGHPKIIYIACQPKLFFPCFLFSASSFLFFVVVVAFFKMLCYHDGADDNDDDDDDDDVGDWGVKGLKPKAKFLMWWGIGE